MYYSFFDDDIETGNRSTNSTVGREGGGQDRPLFLHTTGGRNSEDVALQGF